MDGVPYRGACENRGSYLRVPLRVIGENAEAPPVADAARRFQGSGTFFGAFSVGKRIAATWASADPNGMDGKSGNGGAMRVNEKRENERKRLR